MGSDPGPYCGGGKGVDGLLPAYHALPETSGCGLSNTESQISSPCLHTVQASIAYLRTHTRASEKRCVQRVFSRFHVCDRGSVGAPEDAHLSHTTPCAAQGAAEGGACGCTVCVNAHSVVLFGPCVCAGSAGGQTVGAPLRFESERRSQREPPPV